MTKTMNEQMEEIEIKIKYFEERNCMYILEGLKGRKSQLQTDMQLVEELKEKLIRRLKAGSCATPTGYDIIDEVFKESVGR